MELPLTSRFILNLVLVNCFDIPYNEVVHGDLYCRRIVCEKNQAPN